MLNFLEEAFLNLLIAVSILVMIGGLVELLCRYVPDKWADWLIDHIFLGKR